ncbi:hypothetical protein BSKO_01658 [Bryopsis sp. KO-2023]|nr:hypothetical protein BSKO_01658 [Bryopsis sp. KO-2023]
MTQLTVSASTTLITQGDTDATKFYVLESGRCNVHLFNEAWGGDKLVHTYSPGSGFGELALLYSAPRAATVKTVMPCKLWVMERTIYNTVKHNFDQQMIKERKELVEKVPLLQMLSEEHKIILADALEMVDFQHQDCIITEGEIGDKFYIMKEGKVNVMKGQTVIDKLSAGDYFGERALIRDDQRAATVVSEGYVVCYTLNREAFNNLLGPIETLWRYEVLKKVPILFNLGEHQLWKLAQHMEHAQFRAGDLVLRKYDEGDTFFIIEEGLFSVFDENRTELARVGKGSCFGELALLRREKRAANVSALTDSKCLTLHRDAFDAMLGSLLQIQHVWRFEALRRVPILAQLTAAQRSTLCAAFTQDSYKAGEPIVKQGEEGDRFYIVESGVVGVFKDDNPKPLTKLGPTCYFGELSLLRNDRRAATVKGLTDVTVLSLNRDGFDQLLGPLQQIMQKQASAYDAVSNNKLGTQVRLEDLKQLGVLGTGGFGRVILVSFASKYYALKCMSKPYILEASLQEHVKREKDIMMELQSPFIVNLMVTFKDKYTIYMLMESIMGGELFTYLQKRRRPLTEAHAKFYAASVICAFEYMQARHCVYRDLKPENLLIDTNGYVKVTDFGFAKKILNGGKTYTLCGTPEYLAPELVTQTGHNAGADWWALGVLIYELVIGRPPFYDEDRVKMFKKICEVRYQFPATMSQELRDLLRRLLVKKPAMRLGAQKSGAGDVKSHPWFNGFDWNAFQKLEMKAPYIPKVSNPEDTSNFAPPADANTHPATQRPKRYVSTGVFKDF